MRARLTAFLTALLMLTGLLPVSALAANTGGRSYTRSNPWLPPAPYTDAPTYSAPQTYGTAQFETDPAAVSAALRDAMEQRSPSITIYYRADHELTDPELDALFDDAFAHTGIPTQGDYLRLSWQRYTINIDCQYADGSYDHTLTYQITYETTAAQEAELAAEIDRVLAGFSFTDSSTDYHKIRTIYDYLCSTIVYDYDTLYDDSYRLKYTAYAALMHKTAVCEGYAELFYRMALRVGLQARIITGRSFGDNHAWNIVQLGNLYYNADSTWDAGEETYKYFLMGSSNFPDHTRDARCSSATFHAQCPTSPNAYIPLCDVHSPVTIAGTAPDCVTEGLTDGSSCQQCGAILTAQEVIPAWGHSYENGTCIRCGEVPYTPFADVSADDYYCNAVLWAVNGGITAGSGTGTFSPDASCTRGQAVTFLWRAAGSPVPTDLACPFEDVAPDDYYYNAVLWAVEQGITSGIGNNKFGPQETCTRAQIVTFLHRSLRPVDTTAEPPFLDVSPTDYFCTPVLWAAEQGITGGIGNGRFGPHAPCTRAQIVTFLNKAYN